MINGGHLVGKYLKEVEKIDIVFGISGGHIEAMLDGFTEYKIRTIDVRHEQAAAMMAHAWSVYTGKPGVCFLTAGPGFANGLTGIANAYLDNAPLVVLCGRHPLPRRSEGSASGDKSDGYRQADHQVGRPPATTSSAFRNTFPSPSGRQWREGPVPCFLNCRRISSA